MPPDVVGQMLADYVVKLVVTEPPSGASGGHDNDHFVRLPEYRAARYHHAR